MNTSKLGIFAKMYYLYFLSTTIYIFGDALQVDCLITHFEKTAEFAEIISFL